MKSAVARVLLRRLPGWGAAVSWADCIAGFTGGGAEVYLERACDQDFLPPAEERPAARALVKTHTTFLMHPTLDAKDIEETCRAAEQSSSWLHRKDPKCWSARVGGRNARPVPPPGSGIEQFETMPGMAGGPRSCLLLWLRGQWSMCRGRTARPALAARPWRSRSWHRGQGKEVQTL